MDHGNGEPAHDNVVVLADYRRGRDGPRERAIAPPSRFDDGATHLYIDLKGNKIDFGLVKVNEHNAFSLLEPWIILGSKLLRFCSE